MPQTPRDIITLIIVSALLCGAIAASSALFPKSYPSQAQGYASATTPTSAIASQQPPTRSDPPALAVHHPRVAPDGVFFLRERVVLTNTSGITGLAPGTGVRLISRNGDMFHVTDDQVTFDVSKEKLTNDVDE